MFNRKPKAPIVILPEVKLLHTKIKLVKEVTLASGTVQQYGGTFSMSAAEIKMNPP